MDFGNLSSFFQMIKGKSPKEFIMNMLGAHSLIIIYVLLMGLLQPLRLLQHNNTKIIFIYYKEGEIDA